MLSRRVVFLAVLAVWIGPANRGLAGETGLAEAGRMIVPPHANADPAPDGSAATSRPYKASVPPTCFARCGTAVLWFRLSRMARGAGEEVSLVDSDALRMLIRPRADSVWVLMHAGPAMTGGSDRGEGGFYWTGAAFTHLKSGRWYHAAWTWDTADSDRNGFYLDGVRQAYGEPFAHPSMFKPAERDVALTIGADGLAVSTLQLYERVLGEAELKAACRRAGHEQYTDEGVRFTGAKFIPADVERDHPVYTTSFDDPSVLKDWRLEGGTRMAVREGKLILENEPGPGDTEAKGSHLVCWLEREVPGDFLLEFSVRPADRQRGLNIVFFSARGLNGESIFEPPIRPRTGVFKEYTDGDINCYHVSYWSGARGTANVRKNKGFHLVAVGEDLVRSGRADGFQTIRVHKRGGTIRCTVDDVLAVSYDDDGKTYGPVHLHSGWIGLRQMGHTGRCEYDHVAVFRLTEPERQTRPCGSRPGE